MANRKDRVLQIAVIGLCIFAYAVIGLGALIEVNMRRMKIETKNEHLERQSPARIIEYIQSVDKIYRTIKGVSPYLRDARARTLAPLFMHVSNESDIPVRTCLLIAKVESDFRLIRSEKDYGMMQINEFWLNRYGVSPQDAMDDWNNLHLFAEIMKELRGKPLSYYHSWTPSVRVKYKKKLDRWAAFM